MTPLMSFWPSIYSRIANQEKLLEYRRSFPKDCTFAYMYISKPTKAICGIVYFGKKYSVSDWKNEYINDSKILNRITEYNDSYKYAMEITGFQEIKPITLDELRENIIGFVAPQSYLLLENNINLKTYIENNLVSVGKKIENDLTDLLPNHICLRY